MIHVSCFQLLTSLVETQTAMDHEMDAYQFTNFYNDIMPVLFAKQIQNSPSPVYLIRDFPELPDVVKGYIPGELSFAKVREITSRCNYDLADEM